MANEKTYQIFCKVNMFKEEWILGEAVGSNPNEAMFALMTADSTFRQHYNRSTQKFWGQPVYSRVVIKNQ